MDFEKLLAGTPYERFAKSIATACGKKGWVTIEQVEDLPSLRLPGLDPYDCLKVLKEAVAATSAVINDGPEKPEVVEPETPESSPVKKRKIISQEEAPADEKEH